MDYSKIPADIPAMPPPSGTQSNFTNPQTLGTTLIALNSVFLGTMLVVVLVRTYARGVLVKSLTLDDYTCILAAVASAFHSSFMIYGTGHGYGTHLWDIRAILLTPRILRLLSADAIIYPVVMLLVKLSIALLYLRLFSVHRKFRYLVYVLLGVCLTFYTGLAIWQIYELLHCTTPTSLDTKVCIVNTDVNLACACFNVATDFYLLALPVPIIMALKLQPSKKFGLLAIFGAGFIATVVSFIRLVYISKTLKSPDLLYNAALTSIFTIIEMNMGIIAASMSSLPIALSRGKTFWNLTLNSLRSNLIFSRGNRSKTSQETDEGTEKYHTDDDLIPHQG